MCELFGVSKQAYYKYDGKAAIRKAVQRELVIQYIKQIRELDPGIGGMKLWHMYQKEFGTNSPVGRDRFEDIVDECGLKVRLRVRAPRTTDSSHGLPTFPNLVKDLIPTAPNQLWVIDITYITIWVGEDRYIFGYLSIVMDAYTKEIIGWSLGETLETSYPLEALRMALRRIEGRTGIALIHHSDRGCQYASKEYVALLRGHDIKISMTECGDPKDNAQAERINNTMKNELLKGKLFTSIEMARSSVADAVNFYNYRRPHMSIDMMTPYEASFHTGELKKHWVSYRERAIESKSGALIVAEESLPCQGSPSGLRPPVNP